MMRAKSINLNVEQADNWTFKFSLTTFSPITMRTVPVDLNSRFVAMGIYNVDGSALLTGYVAGSAAQVACATCGWAYFEFPLSATSGISAGTYRYDVHLLDYPYYASATYRKKLVDGAFTVEVAT